MAHLNILVWILKTPSRSLSATSALQSRRYSDDRTTNTTSSFYDRVISVPLRDISDPQLGGTGKKGPTSSAAVIYFVTCKV